MKKRKARRDRETKAMLRTQLADMSVELMQLRGRLDGNQQRQLIVQLQTMLGHTTAERDRLRVIASNLRRVLNAVLDVEEIARRTMP